MQNHRNFIAALAGLILAGILLVPLSIKWAQSAVGDSGVTACKTISKNMAKKTSSDSKPMTETDYKRIRQPFEDSRYADIKISGMNIVDTIYQADTQPDPKNIGGAIILMGTLQGQWGQLQMACSNHGVDVPALPKG